MPKFISDEEMAKLDERVPASKGFVSDEDMAKMETGSAGEPKPEPGIGESLARGAVSAIPFVAGAAGGMLGTAAAGPVGTVGGAGLAYAGGKEVEKLANHYLFGDELPEEGIVKSTSRVGGNVRDGAMMEMGGQALQAVPAAIKSGAEGLATTPLFDKVANATNVVGKGRDFISKVTAPIMDQLSPGVKKAADVATAVAGRFGAYKTPLAPVQAVSDAASVASGAQKGLAWLMDNAPDKLGKFAPALKEAASRGSKALAATSFILQQREPEFVKILSQAPGGER